MKFNVDKNQILLQKNILKVGFFKKKNIISPIQKKRVSDARLKLNQALPVQPITRGLFKKKIQINQALPVQQNIRLWSSTGITRRMFHSEGGGPLDEVLIRKSGIHFKEKWIGYCYEEDRADRDEWSVREDHWANTLTPENVVTFQGSLPPKADEAKKYLALWNEVIWDISFDKAPFEKAELVLLRQRADGSKYEWKSDIVRIVYFDYMYECYREAIAGDILGEGVVLEAAFRLHQLTFKDRFDNLEAKFSKQVSWEPEIIKDIHGENYKYFTTMYKRNPGYWSFLEKCIQLEEYNQEGKFDFAINSVRSSISFFLHKKNFEVRLSLMSLKELKTIHLIFERAQTNFLKQPLVQEKLKKYIIKIAKDGKYLKFLKKCIEDKECSNKVERNSIQGSIRYYITLGYDKNLPNLTWMELNFILETLEKNEKKLRDDLAKPISNVEYYLDLARKDDRYVIVASLCLTLKKYEAQKGFSKEKNSTKTNLRYHFKPSNDKSKSALDKNFLKLSLEQVEYVYTTYKEEQKMFLKAIRAPRVGLKASQLQYYIDLARTDRRYNKLVQLCLLLKKYEAQKGFNKEKNSTRSNIKYYIKIGLDKKFLKLSVDELKQITKKLKELNIEIRTVWNPTKTSNIKSNKLVTASELQYYIDLARKDPRYVKVISLCLTLKKYEAQKGFRKEKNSTKSNLRYYFKSGLDENFLRLSVEQLKHIHKKLEVEMTDKPNAKSNKLVTAFSLNLLGS